MTATTMLDGRQFTAIWHARFTANQEDYVTGHLRLAGAVEILHDLDGEKRTEEQRAEALHTQILLSGRTPYILAGCLTEEGTTWNRMEADRNAERFGEIIDVSEKLALQKLLVTFIAELLIVRERLSNVSQKPSGESADVHSEPNVVPSIN